MKLSIIGTGYVGLVTGACLAEKGHEVICVDMNPERVAALNSAKSPIYEEGLDALLARHVGKNLRATSDLAAAVLASDVTFIAVGTPFDGKTIDLTAVLGATREIGEALKSKQGYHLVVVKSTVVPGTTDTHVLPALEKASGKKAGADFGVGMNPEFLSEGEAVQDFLFPDRIVIGGIDARSSQLLTDIYLPYDASVPRLMTNTRTAEMIKYASNSLLAALISFSNELANLGAALGNIDTTEVMRGVHLSQYFRGRNAEGLPPIVSFLKAGCGFGGSCLPKDVSALIAHGHRLAVDMPLLQATLDINKGQPRNTVDLIKKHHKNLRGLKVAVLGLAFKPETSDVRESPAFPIMQQLLEEGAIVTAVDPIAVHEARKAFPDSRVKYTDAIASTVADADAIVVVTPWKQFAGVPEMIMKRAQPPVFIDGRRAYDKTSVSRYEGIGL
jgi:UDPglucose 6-dehydrogenase/GDP-mannose 6-dehydrogenase